MRADLFQKLMEAREALHDAEAEHPESPPLARLHEVLRRGLYRLRHTCGLTDEQVAALDEPPAGGGTPKTPPGEGEG